jgi:hypothetical protein
LHQDPVGFSIIPDTILGMTYVYGANKIFVSHEHTGHSAAKNDCKNPGSEKSFHGLLRGQFDELSSSNCNPNEVGEDIIANNKRYGQEEPDHSLKHIVHDEMGLHHDQVQGHVRPGELRELESVVTSLEGGDEEHETCKL